MNPTYDNTPYEPPARAAIWPAVFLLASALFNDWLLYWLTYQGPSRTTRIDIVIGAGAAEIAVLSGLLKRTGRYKHRWVPLAVVALAALMLAAGYAFVMVAVLTSPPDNS